MRMSVRWIAFNCLLFSGCSAQTGNQSTATPAPHDTRAGDNLAHAAPAAPEQPPARLGADHGSSDVDNALREGIEAFNKGD